VKNDIKVFTSLESSINIREIFIRKRWNKTITNMKENLVKTQSLNNWIKKITDLAVDYETLRDWFQDCPIETRERLRNRSDRVSKELQNIAKHYSDRNNRVVELNERGEAKWSKQSELNKDHIAYRTIVLPVDAGGLSQEGMLDGALKEPATDVAENRKAKDRKRVLLICRGDTYWEKPLERI